MSNRSGLLRGLFSRSGDEPTISQLDDALDGYIDPDEGIQYRLSGSDISREPNTGTLDGSDGTLAVLTDRRFLFVAHSGNDETVVDIPHAEIRDIELDSGLLSTTLVVDVWDEGTYRLESVDGPVSEAVEYASETSEAWQFVDALADELQGYAASIERHIEDGQFDRARSVLSEARETMDELVERVEESDVGPVLRERVEEARHDLQRVRVQARTERAAELVSRAEAKHLDVGNPADYTGAYERYTSARGHLDTALSIAREYDLEERADVQALCERVDRGLDVLAAQPVGLAKQATERALGTDHLDVRVETLQAALEHYHDALTLGWGTSLEPTVDREDLRFRVALTAVGLVDARREYAARLETAADTLTDRGDIVAARERYRQADDQLAAAADLAREFRMPDPEPVERDRDRLAEKLDAATD